MNNTLTHLSVKQLKQAIKIKTKLEALQDALNDILGQEAPAPGPGKKRGMSAAGRAAIAAGQKARWAKVKGEEKPAKKGRRNMSAAAKARISAAAKKRWKAAKLAGKTSLAG